mmetsp:Transcript_22688/g.22891  ORF Transcript_22688/g.22891 Transcript_22688/m.22891 type:complete len:339 (+) Transcript_22688:197-1213(+)
MRQLSSYLREIAVETLMKGNQTLILEDGENTTSNDLLKIVADHYNLSPAAYCQQMRHSRTWGGGPEIVAICNFLERPIYVYELGVRHFLKKSFELKLCARFGTPHFNRKSPISILCADGRFPHIRPGHHKRTGDHFLALFPLDLSDPSHHSHLSHYYDSAGSSGGGGGGGRLAGLHCWWSRLTSRCLPRRRRYREKEREREREREGDELSRQREGRAALKTETIYSPNPLQWVQSLLGEAFAGTLEHLGQWSWSGGAEEEDLDEDLFRIPLLCEEDGEGAVWEGAGGGACQLRGAALVGGSANVLSTSVENKTQRERETETETETEGGDRRRDGHYRG